MAASIIFRSRLSNSPRTSCWSATLAGPNSSPGPFYAILRSSRSTGGWSRPRARPARPGAGPRSSRPYGPPWRPRAWARLPLKSCSTSWWPSARSTLPRVRQSRSSPAARHPGRNFRRAAGVDAARHVHHHRLRGRHGQHRPVLRSALPGPDLRAPGTGTGARDREGGQAGLAVPGKIQPYVSRAEPNVVRALTQAAQELGVAARTGLTVSNSGFSRPRDATSRGCGQARRIWTGFSANSTPAWTD